MPTDDDLTAVEPSPSVVIPTHNRRERILALVGRLLADDGDGEIVVVDDCSRDGTADALKALVAGSPRLHVLALTEPAGASRARLAGARAASGDVLVMLDDDVMPAPGLVAKHVAHHAAYRATSPDDPDGLLVLGYMPTTVPSPLPAGAFATALYAQEYEKRCAGYERDPSTIMTALWLGNASLSRARYLHAFESGLMPTFPYRHEDRILGIVLRDLGVHGVFDRTIHATHEHNRPLPKFLKDAYDNGRGREEIHRLYPEVVPDDAEQEYLSDLPAPLRALVSSTSREPVRRAVVGTLSTGIRATGRLGARGPETTLAKIARRVELMHGARAARGAQRG